MAHESWVDTTVGASLSTAFPGEWGADPIPAHNAIVLRSTDIDDDGHVPGAGARRRVSAKKVASKRLRPGDILLETSGGGPGKPVGRVAAFESSRPEPQLVSNFFRTLRPRDGVHGGFLAYRLLHLYRSPAIWALQQQTTGIINLKVHEYLRQPLRLPDEHEQARIAEVLDTIDDTIRDTQQVIAKLEQVKRGLLHDLLTRGIDDNGEIRDPELHPERFKDSPLGQIPKPWMLKSLRDLAEVRSGIAKNEGVPVSNPVEVAYLRVANVQDGYLDLSEMKTLRVSRSELQNFRVLPGNVLMNEGGDRDKLGRGAIWRGEFDPCVHQNHVFVVRCSQGLRPAFLDAWTGGTIAKRYFMVAGKQSTNLASINKTSLGRLPVVVPALAEQDRSIVALPRSPGR